MGAVVAAVLVVGLGFGLNHLQAGVNIVGTSSDASASSAGTPTLNANGWFGSEAPPAECGNTSMGLDTRDGGPGASYNMSFYLPAYPAGAPRSAGHWNYPLGGDLCIYTYLQIGNTNSTALPTGESVTVWATNATGDSLGTFYQGSCAAPTSYSPPIGWNSTGWNCNVVWNTSHPYGGISPRAETQYDTPGTEYWVRATVEFSGSHPLTFGDAAPFGFYNESGDLAAATSTTATRALMCGGQTFKMLTALDGGPLSLNVMTDQGASVDNGTVFVTHVAPNGTVADYCLHPTLTGFHQVVADDGLPPTGTYNMTVYAGFAQGPGYGERLPPIALAPGTSVDVTLSVPSGAVSVVTSTQGSNSVSTTTTTATSVPLPARPA